MYTWTISKITYNLDIFLPKPKFTFRNLKKGVKEFHGKFVIAPADKAANWSFGKCTSLGT